LQSTKSFDGQNAEVDRAVKLYNYEKPHKSLGRQTPMNRKDLSLKQRSSRGLQMLPIKTEVEPCQKTVIAI